MTSNQEPRRATGPHIESFSSRRSNHSHGHRAGFCSAIVPSMKSAVLNDAFSGSDTHLAPIKQYQRDLACNHGTVVNSVCCMHGA
jgi:hypothetical protein